MEIQGVPRKRDCVGKKWLFLRETPGLQGGNPWLPATSMFSTRENPGLSNKKDWFNLINLFLRRGLGGRSSCKQCFNNVSGSFVIV